MMAVCIMEVFFYSINENIANILKVADIGGSMVIHIFGAYFGLAGVYFFNFILFYFAINFLINFSASVMMTSHGAKGNKDNSAVYRSDLFSMIGTIFLWIFWPSFNGAFGMA